MENKSINTIANVSDAEASKLAERVVTEIDGVLCRKLRELKPEITLINAWFVANLGTGKTLMECDSFDEFCGKKLHRTKQAVYKMLDLNGNYSKPKSEPETEVESYVSDETEAEDEGESETDDEPTPTKPAILTHAPHDKRTGETLCCLHFGGEKYVKDGGAPTCPKCLKKLAEAEKRSEAARKANATRKAAESTGTATDELDYRGMVLELLAVIKACDGQVPIVLVHTADNIANRMSGKPVTPVADPDAKPEVVDSGTHKGTFWKITDLKDGHWELRENGKVACISATLEAAYSNVPGVNDLAVA